MPLGGPNGTLQILLPVRVWDIGYDYCDVVHAGMRQIDAQNAMTSHHTGIVGGLAFHALITRPWLLPRPRPHVCFQHRTLVKKRLKEITQSWQRMLKEKYNAP